MLYIYFSDQTFCIAPKGKIAAFGNYQVKKKQGRMMLMHVLLTKTMDLLPWKNPKFAFFIEICSYCLLRLLFYLEHQ